MHGRRARRGQFVILTAVILVISILLIATVLNTAIISRTEYLEINYREIVQKISIDYPKALSGALANASLTFKAKGNIGGAISNAEIWLTNWREYVVKTYAGLGVKLNVSNSMSDLVNLAWGDYEGDSSISADIKLDLTTLGFSGWEDTRTVDLHAEVKPESVKVAPDRLSFNLTLLREDNSPVATLTNDLLEMKAHFIGSERTFEDINASTLTLRYFGNGLYNVTSVTGKPDTTVDAFQLFAFDDSGVVVGLTVDLTVPSDVALVKSIKLTTYSGSTKATVKVVSIHNEPVEGATIYAHWEGNVTTADRQPLMLKTDVNGIAENTATSSSLFKKNVTTNRNSNVGRIDFVVDDVSFVPVIGIVKPLYAANLNGWSNVNNALGEGGTTPASASTSGSKATFSGYDFSKIPSSVKIMNIWLRLDAWKMPPGSGMCYIRSEISYDGGLTFPSFADRYVLNYGTTGTTEPLPSDTYPLWVQLNSTDSYGWNVTRLQSSSFFFRLNKVTFSGTNTVYLDFVPIIVLYQPNYVYEPLRSVTQATAVKRGASNFVVGGGWTNPQNAFGNDTSFASATNPPITLRPNSNGTYQQWTTFGSGSNHWGRTSDQNDNTGVQIAGSTSANETESFQDTSQTGAISSVTAHMTAKATAINVTFVGAGSGSGTTGNPTPSYPTGLQANDLILLQVTVRDTVTTPTIPSGFTLLYGPDSTGIGRQWIYYRISDGTQTGTITVTIGNSTVKIARMYAFRNVALSNFAEGGGFGFGTVSTISAQSVTTGGPKRLALSFVFENYNNAVDSFTGETGGDWTEAVAEFSTTAGSRGCVQLQTAAISPNGTISGGNYTMSSAQRWGVRAFALVPIDPDDSVEKAVIVWRTYSNNYESSNFTVSRTGFTDYFETRTINPATGKAWTWNEINASQIGARASILGKNESIQVSEFWIVVTHPPPNETYYGFNFNVPSDSIIDYVDVQADLWLQSSGNDYVNMSLSRDSGVTWTPAQPVRPIVITRVNLSY